MKNEHIDISNAREGEQIEVMKKILSEGHCPFCKEQLDLYHKKPILKETKNWVLTENQWPYKKTKKHLLVILKNHSSNLNDVPEGAFEEIGELFKWAEKEFKMIGGAWGFGSAIASRFGNPEFSGATVSHIHAQIIFPDVEDLEENESVVFYIGKPQKKTT